MRAVGNLQNLIAEAGTNGSSARHGVGHTRWATHGGVTERNAHPLTGCDSAKLAIVLNGIIENYRELRDELWPRATSSPPRRTPRWSRTCSSASTRRPAAVARVYPLLEGHFTIVAIHHESPQVLVGVRHQTPLVVGVGEGENFLASNVAAFLSETRRAIFPADGQVVAVTPERPASLSTAPRSTRPPSRSSTGTTSRPSAAATRRFMLKEIYEQPEAVAETLGERIRHGRLELEGLGLDDGSSSGCAASSSSPAAPPTTPASSAAT